MVDDNGNPVDENGNPIDTTAVSQDAPPPVQADPTAVDLSGATNFDTGGGGSLVSPSDAGSALLGPTATDFSVSPGGGAGPTFANPSGGFFDASGNPVGGGGGAPPPGMPSGGGGGGGGGQGAPGAPGAPGEPGQAAPRLQGGGMWSEADFQAYMQYLKKQADVESQRYTQSFGLEQSKFGLQQQQFGLEQTKQQAQVAQFQKDLDLRTAIANATQAYQTSLIQTRNVELAQNAARDAMTRDFQMQDLAFRRQQNATSVDIEREKLDLQRRLLPAARTTRRAATVQNI